jgi:hypothetical protein
MSLEWVANDFHDSQSSQVPVYKINGTDIDRLVMIIFAVSSRSPLFFTNSLKFNSHARESLTRYHPDAAKIIGE